MQNATNIFRFIQESFRGLRREVWILALVTLINRAGTMVIPFLSLYLTKKLNFTLVDVGWIMSVFGAGSVFGAWMGGKLCDRIGFYKVILWSLIISGFLFIGLQYLHSFVGFCLGIFILTTVSDSLRPAVYVAIGKYSKPENRTRSITLLRLAINLGFSVGPAVGGMIITLIGYGGLFWVDGITCIIAGIVVLLMLESRPSTDKASENIKAYNRSPYKDRPYWIFLFATAVIGIAFVQYFSTVPLYYKNVHGLSEDEIGLLFSLNGLLIFLIEMPLIKFFETDRFSIYRILFTSTLMIAASFIVMNWTSWSGILIIGMVFMTFGEMLNFPFLSRFSMDRADGGNTGTYMALFTMAFSISHIFGHSSGMQLINWLGYETTWYIMAGILAFAAVLFVVLQIIVEKDKGRKAS